jgi:hypothetical protein
MNPQLFDLEWFTIQKKQHKRARGLSDITENRMIPTIPHFLKKKTGTTYGSGL